MQLPFALLATAVLVPSLPPAAGPAQLRAAAHDTYQWYDAAYPVVASGLGDHRYDTQLTDYRMSEVVRRRQHINKLLAQVRALSTSGWSKDDRIDRILFESQLTSQDFFGRRLDPERTDPQLYVNECTNSIFTLLQKDYAPHHTRALAATTRLE